MAELEKMRRTAAKVIPDAPHEVLLVLDATTGQNGLEQARKFTESAASPASCSPNWTARPRAASWWPSRAS